MAQKFTMLLANQQRMQGCTWSASATAPTGPVANLLTREPSQPAIFSDPSEVSIRSTLAASAGLRLFWLGFMDCTDAATWRLQGRLLGSTVYDSRVGSTDLPCADDARALPHRKLRRHCAILLDEALSMDEVEVTVFDPTNTTGRLRIGNAVFDDPFQPAINDDWGRTMPSLIDPSRASTSAKGQSAPLNRAPYDVAELRLGTLTEDEALGTLRDFNEYTGTTKPALLWFDPLESRWRERRMVYGLFQALQPVTLPKWNINSTSYRIEELIP